MGYSILLKCQTMSDKIDSLNRSIKCTSALENGFVVNLGAVSTTSGEGEVFIASTPIASTPVGIWMVAEPEVVVTNSQYKGLDPDIRGFFIPASTVCTAFKTKKYDIIKLSADAFSNTKASASYVYANVTSGSFDLAWATAESSATLLKWLSTDSLPIAGGSPGNNRVTVYKMEVINE